jgi:hypothetical protein
VRRSHETPLGILVDGELVWVKVPGIEPNRSEEWPSKGMMEESDALAVAKARAGDPEAFRLLKMKVVSFRSGPENAMQRKSWPAASRKLQLNEP